MRSELSAKARCETMTKQSPTFSQPRFNDVEKATRLMRVMLDAMATSIRHWSRMTLHGLVIGTLWKRCVEARMLHDSKRPSA